MGTTTSYSGRTVDLCIYEGFNFNSPLKQEASFSLNSETGGLLCTGVVKLAQKCVTRILTDSVEHEKSINSLLAESILGGINIGPTLWHYGTATVQLLGSLIKDEQKDLDIPDDETLSSITLDSWEHDRVNSSAVFYITLNTVAGTSAPLVIPIGLQI